MPFGGHFFVKFYHCKKLYPYSANFSVKIFYCRSKLLTFLKKLVFKRGVYRVAGNIFTKNFQNNILFSICSDSHNKDIVNLGRMTHPFFQVIIQKLLLFSHWIVLNTKDKPFKVFLH